MVWQLSQTGGRGSVAPDRCGVRYLCRDNDVRGALTLSHLSNLGNHRVARLQIRVENVARVDDLYR
eukprot:scaffold296859_cov33-Tisochrysis_lutea.AAC.4